MAGEAKDSRAVNFELLRIVAMLMVVMLHALRAGGILVACPFGSANYILFSVLESLTYPAVNLFALITGYFMVNVWWKPSRLARILTQVWFYSPLCLALAVWALGGKAGTADFANALFPVSGKSYWYASAYVVLLCLMPGMNAAIHAMDQRALGRFVASLLLLFTVVPTVLFWMRDWLVESGYSFAWLAVLYFVGAYIRLYGNALPEWIRRFARDKRLCLGTYMFLAAVRVVSKLVVGAVSGRLLGEVQVGLFSGYNNIWTVTIALVLFALIKNLEVRNRTLAGMIGRLGGLSFGAYLLTDHTVIRNRLWSRINLPGILAGRGTLLTVGCVLLTAICLFAAGCATEWLRRKAMGLLGADRMFDRLDQRFLNREQS